MIYAQRKPDSDNTNKISTFHYFLNFIPCNDYIIPELFAINKDSKLNYKLKFKMKLNTCLTNWLHCNN